VRQMKEMGLFGLNIPERYGGAEVDTTTFAMVFEEISRGWLGLAGIIGSHSVMCDVLARFGTEEQKRRFLPDLATGERRGGICLTESNAGTDLQNISTTATRDGEVYRINGSKMGDPARPPWNHVSAAGKDGPRRRAGASRDERLHD